VSAGELTTATSPIDLGGQDLVVKALLGNDLHSVEGRVSARLRYTTTRFDRSDSSATRGFSKSRSIEVNFT
jgi:hypothetical protein